MGGGSGSCEGGGGSEVGRLVRLGLGVCGGGVGGETTGSGRAVKTRRRRVALALPLPPATV